MTLVQETLECEQEIARLLSLLEDLTQATKRTNERLAELESRHSYLLVQMQRQDRDLDRL